MPAQEKRITIDKYRTITEIMLCIFAAECVFGCSGRWFVIHGISIRMILFVCCLFLSVPFVFLNREQLKGSIDLKLICIYLFFIAIATVIGLRRGNPIAYIWGDISPILMLLIIPGLMSIYDDYEKIVRLMDVVFVASVFIAIYTAAIHFVMPFLSNSQIMGVKAFIEAKHLGGIAPLDTGIGRIYFRSQIFIQFSYIYGIWRFMKIQDKTRRICWITCEGLLIFAMIISYTRGFWLGCALSGVILLCWRRSEWKRIIGVVLGSLAVLLLLIALSTAVYGRPYAAVETVNRIKPDLITIEKMDRDFFEMDDRSGSVKLANEESARLREATKAETKKKIKEHPWLGNGLGTVLVGVREEGKSEYMYMDVLMKMGIFGVISFILAFFHAASSHLIKDIKISQSYKTDGRTDTQDMATYVCAAYIGVAFTSWFNPFLLSPMGILMLGVVVTTCFMLENGNEARHN